MELVNIGPLKYLLKCVQYRSLTLSERQHCFDALNSAGDTTLSQFVSADGIIDGGKLASLRSQQVRQEISAEFTTFRDINAACEIILRLCNSTYLEPLIVARYLKRHEDVFGPATDVNKDTVVDALEARILPQLFSERAVTISCQAVIYSWPTSAAHLAPLSRMFAAYTDFLQEKHPDLCEMCAQSVDRLLARLESHNFASHFQFNHVRGVASPSPLGVTARNASIRSRFLNHAVTEVFCMLKLLLATLQRFPYNQTTITSIMDVVRRTLLWLSSIEANKTELGSYGRNVSSPSNVKNFHENFGDSFRYIRACCALITMSVIEAYFDISEYMDVLPAEDDLFQPALFYWAALRTGSATPVATHADEGAVIFKTFRSSMLISFNNLLEDDPHFLEDYLRKSVREKLYMPFLTAVLSRNYWRFYMQSANFRRALCELVYNCFSLPSCASQFWQGLLLDQSSQPIAFIEYGNWLHMHPVASQLQYNAIAGLLRSIGGVGDPPVAQKALAMLEQHIWSLKYVTVEAGKDLFTSGIAQRRQRQIMGQHQLMQIVLRDDMNVPGVDGLVLPAGTTGIVLGDLNKGFSEDDEDAENDDYSVNNNTSENVFVKFALDTSANNEVDDGRSDGNNNVWRSALSCIKTFREYALGSKPSLSEVDASDICMNMLGVARLLLSFVQSYTELSTGGALTDGHSDAADIARRYLSRIVAVTEEFHTGFQVLLALIEAKQTSDSLPCNVADLLQVSMRMTFELARVRSTRYDFNKLVQIMPHFGHSTDGGNTNIDNSFFGDAEMNTSCDGRLLTGESASDSLLLTSHTGGSANADAVMLSNVSKWWRNLASSCLSGNVDERAKRRLFGCVEVLLDVLQAVNSVDDAQNQLNSAWLSKAPQVYYACVRSSTLFVMKLLAPPLIAAARGRSVKVRVLELILNCLQQNPSQSTAVDDQTSTWANDFRQWLCESVNSMLVNSTLGVSIVDLMRNFSYDVRMGKLHSERHTLAFTATVIVRLVLYKLIDSRKQQSLGFATDDVPSAASGGGGGEPVSSLKTLFERELFANAGPTINDELVTSSYAPKQMVLQRNAEANLCALAVYATIANADNQSRIAALNTLALVVDSYRFSLAGCLGEKVANELRFSIFDQLMPFSQPSAIQKQALYEESSLISLNVENVELTNACLQLLARSMPNHLPFAEPYLNCMYERVANAPATPNTVNFSTKSPSNDADFFTRKKFADAASLLDMLIGFIADDPNFASKVSCGDGCRSVQRAALNMLTTLWSKQVYVAIDYIMQHHSTQLFASLRRIMEQACSNWFEIPFIDNNSNNAANNDAEDGMATEGADFLLRARLETFTGVLRLLAAQLMLQQWQSAARATVGLSEHQQKHDRQWEENMWNVCVKTGTAAAPPLFDELAKVILIKVPKLLNKRKRRVDIEGDDAMETNSGEENEVDDESLTFGATDAAFAWRNFMLLFMAASDKSADVSQELSTKAPSQKRVNFGTLEASNDSVVTQVILSTPIEPARIQKLIVRVLAAMQKWFSEPHFVSDSYKSAIMGFAKQLFLKHCQFFSTFALTALARLHSIVYLLCGSENLALHTDLARSMILSMIEPIFDSLSASPAALVILGTDAWRSAPPAIAAAVSSTTVRKRGGSLYPNLSALIEGSNTDDGVASTNVPSNYAADDSTSFIAERLLLSVLSSLLDYFDAALERWATFGVDVREILIDVGESNVRSNAAVIDHDAFVALKQVLDIIYHVVRCMRAISPTQFEGTFFHHQVSDVDIDPLYEYENDDYEDEETAGVIRRPPLLGQRSPHATKTMPVTPTTPRRLLKSTRSRAAGSAMVASKSQSVTGEGGATPYDKYRWERIILKRETVNKCVSIAETCMKAVKYPQFVRSLLKLLYTMAVENDGRPNSAVCASMNACDLVSRLGWSLTTPFRPEFDHRLTAHFSTWTENLTLVCDIMHASLLERHHSTLIEADIVDFFASLSWRTSIVRLYSVVDSNKWALPATLWQQRVSDTLAACIQLMGAVFRNVFVENALFYDNHARVSGFTKRFFTDLTPPKQLVLDGYLRLTSHVLNSVAYVLLSTNFGRSRRHHHKRTSSKSGDGSRGRSEERSVLRGAGFKRKELVLPGSSGSITRNPIKDAAEKQNTLPRGRNPSTSPHRAGQQQAHQQHVGGRDPQYIKRVLVASKAQFQLTITALQAFNAILPELDELILDKPLSKLPFSQYFLHPSFSLPSFTSSLSSSGGRSISDAVAKPLPMSGRPPAISQPFAFTTQLHSASSANSIGFAREFDLSYGTLLSLCSSCIDYLKEVMRLLVEETGSDFSNRSPAAASNVQNSSALTSDEQAQLCALQTLINETLDLALLVTMKNGLLHLRVAVDAEFAAHLCGVFDEKLSAAARAAAAANIASVSATSATVCTDLHQELKSIVRQLDRHSAHNLSGLQDSSSSQSQSHSQEELASILSIAGGEGSPGSGLKKFGGGLSRDSSVILPCTIPSVLREAETLRDLLLFIIVYVKPFKFNDRQLATLLNSVGGKSSSTSTQPWPTLVGLSGNQWQPPQNTVQQQQQIPLNNSYQTMHSPSPPYFSATSTAPLTPSATAGGAWARPTPCAQDLSQYSPGPKNVRSTLPAQSPVTTAGGGGGVLPQTLPTSNTRMTQYVNPAPPRSPGFVLSKFAGLFK